MTTFALVHGGWHGAWCWERLAPLLQQAGHDVMAMDLPILAPRLKLRSKSARIALRNFSFEPRAN